MGATAFGSGAGGDLCTVGERPRLSAGGGFKYGKNKKEAAEERKRLFRIIEELVLWENTTNERVLEAARAEIRRSWREDRRIQPGSPGSR